MLFGKNGNNTADNMQPPQPQGAMMFDVSTVEFEDKVMQASMQIPVIVDFWAPWCGPCKQLMPVLERVIASYGGKILLAKVNLDENPDLAQALRVQSVPTVFAFFQGQPVTAFQGVRPESEIKAFCDQLLKAAQQGQPDAADIPQILADAAKALAEDDIGLAQNLYVQVLQDDETNVDAFAGLVRTFIAAGQIEQAEGMIDNAPEEMTKTPQFKAVKTALELAQMGGDTGDLTALGEKVAANPDDLQARFDYGMALFGAGRREEAVDQMVGIISRDREWEEDKGRVQLLKFFEAMGPSDPVSVAGRRKLSRLLFS